MRIKYRKTLSLEMHSKTVYKYIIARRDWKMGCVSCVYSKAYTKYKYKCSDIARNIILLIHIVYRFVLVFKILNSYVNISENSRKLSVCLVAVLK